MLSSDLTPAALFASLVVSSVGLGLYVSGKRRQRLPHLLAGLLLMGLPLALHGALALSVATAMTLAGLWLAARAA